MVCVKRSLLLATASAVLAMGSALPAQQIIYGGAMNGSAINNGMAPGGVVFCSKCGTYHAASGSSAPRSSTSNVLSALNVQRSRQGLRPLRPDAQLQSVAQRRVAVMAASGMKGHPPGSFAPGRYEGVGWSSSYSPSGVSACYTSDPNMSVAGAAMARGRDGVYFCVVYR